MAQEPWLFEFDWQLEQMRVDGVFSEPPSNSEINLVPMQIMDEDPNPDYMFTVACNSLEANVTYPAPFKIIFDGIISTLIKCEIPENSAFESDYFNFFLSSEGQELEYSFIVTLTGDYIGLVIFKDVNNHLTYNNGILNTDEFEQRSLVVYPNPARKVLKWNAPEAENQLAQIYSLDGRLLLTQNTATNQIDVSGMAAGVYFLELTGKEGSIVKRFVKN